MTDERPSYALYSPRAIAVCTVLFSPLVGAMMVLIDERRLGKERQGWIVLGATVLALAVVVVLGFVLPESMQSATTGATGGLTVTCAYAFVQQVKARFEAHVAAGGAVASPIPFAASGTLVVAGVLVLVLYPLVFGTEARFQQGVEAYEQARYVEAEAAFREVIAADPGHHAARYDLGLTLAQEGRADQAIELLRGIPDDGSPVAQQSARLRQRLAVGLGP